MAKSKYIEISTMSMADFAKSPVGTEAKFFLNTCPNARLEVSKSLKAACVKRKSVCKIDARQILIEQDNGSWLPTHFVTATIESVAE